MPHLCSHTADTGKDPYLREKSDSRFMCSSVGWTTSVRKLNSTDVTKTVFFIYIAQLRNLKPDIYLHWHKHKYVWYKELGHLTAKTFSELHFKWALFFWSKTYFSPCFQHYMFVQLRDVLPFCKKHRHHITQIVFPSCITPFCLLIIICTCTLPLKCLLFMCTNRLVPLCNNIQHHLLSETRFFCVTLWYLCS